ncbi:Gamma-tubulin complex component 5 [Apophysomyces ossiformis]|uniref:Spindle pole body component n=1 Tax=Apophysomyces ossiformis TaxID=679940 RepID=A0A8H7EVB6_9FUNG|nr:Gamma-tubulin complex component 5 [Apophysomyces ossiformis]
MGYDRRADLLKTYTSSFLDTDRPISPAETNQRILKYDVLSLLLALSSSPLSVEYKEPKSTPVVRKNVWKELTEEEPFTGEHWLEPDNMSSEDDWSEEDFELDKEHIKQQAGGRCCDVLKKRKVRQAENQLEERLFEEKTDRMDMDVQGDPEVLDRVKSRQYWREGNSMKIVDTSNEPIMRNACRLRAVVDAYQNKDSADYAPFNIDEIDAIREVIFLLRGCEGAIFRLEEDHMPRYFLIDESFAIKHLSGASIRKLWEKFCKLGNVLSVLSVLHLTTLSYGQIYQAFAVAVANTLQEFESTITQMEWNYLNPSHGNEQVSSLLKLEMCLNEPMKYFENLHDIIIKDMSIDSSSTPKEIAEQILSVLYNHVYEAQMANERATFLTLLRIFQKTLVPYGRMMDDWIFHGSLLGDLANEFFVSRSPSVDEDSSSFWASGFQSQWVNDKYDHACPLFEQRFTARAFYTGKAVYLMSRLQSSNEREHQYRSFGETFSQIMFTEPENLQMVETCPTVRKSDVFARTLFPLTSAQHHTTTDRDLKVPDGILFQQAMIRCTETYIDFPYETSCYEMNQILQNNCGLSQHLLSLASVYLMLEGDCMHSFCEALFAHMDQKMLWQRGELQKMFVDACSQSLMDDQIQVRINVPQEIASTSIASGLDYIVFECNTPWPINNFISDATLPDYNKIAVLLLRLKRAKYVLEKRSIFYGQPLIDNPMQFYSMRMRLMWFVNTFWRYIMTTILHAETIKFRENLSKTNDVDEITVLHGNYVRRIVDRCLLNEKTKPIMNAIVQILNMVETLATLFDQISSVDDTPANVRESNNRTISQLEIHFSRIHQFVSKSLSILGQKGGFPWFEALSLSLEPNRVDENPLRGA